MIQNDKDDTLTLDQTLALERKVWEALVAGEPEADGAMLTEDFLGVYVSGFSDRAGHMAELSGGPTMAEFRLSQARLMRLGPGRVLLSYRAEYRKPARKSWEAMYISSLWERRGAAWLNVFSQDTPTPV
ncbi:nuclear transport factor 2 family protein [Shimia sp.]|uniref:nuclear transport factor 2 family protein n=1 Tax=Shimia sp. TaxID=1954381 RepID=UPI003299C682